LIRLVRVSWEEDERERVGGQMWLICFGRKEGKENHLRQERFGRGKTQLDESSGGQLARLYARGDGARQAGKISDMGCHSNCLD
jgi:hypothetical protein